METAVVLIVNVADDFPAATVTEEGNDAEEELLDSPTNDPPVGAALLSVTVPVDEDPPDTLEGFKLTEIGAIGTIVSFAVWPTPGVAETSATSDAVTVVVFTVNVALVLPAATVTVDGTMAVALSLERDTTNPPVGAGRLNVNVPVDEFPPSTDEGFSATEITWMLFKARRVVPDPTNRVPSSPMAGVVDTFGTE